jgi:uncharacterized protein
MPAVTVAYAAPGIEDVTALALPGPATVADAVAASGLIERYQLAGADIGYAIFGQRAEPGTPLRDGDRIELTRPLQVDAMAARRLRAARRARG